jgi:hypothetical protein
MNRIHVDEVSLMFTFHYFKIQWKRNNLPIFFIMQFLYKKLELIFKIVIHIK